MTKRDIPVKDFRRRAFGHNNFSISDYTRVTITYIILLSYKCQGQPKSSITCILLPKSFSQIHLQTKGCVSYALLLSEDANDRLDNTIRYFSAPCQLMQVMLDIGVMLKFQSSKYLNVFIRLKFSHAPLKVRELRLALEQTISFIDGHSFI